MTFIINPLFFFLIPSLLQIKTWSVFAAMRASGTQELNECAPSLRKSNWSGLSRSLTASSTWSAASDSTLPPSSIFQNLRWEKSPSLVISVVKQNLFHFISFDKIMFNSNSIPQLKALLFSINRWINELKYDWFIMKITRRSKIKTCRWICQLYLVYQ